MRSVPSETSRGVGAQPLPLGFHVTMRLAEDRVIARTMSDVRQIATLMLRFGRARGLIAFAIADTHIHAVIEGPRAAAGKLAQVLETAIRKRRRSDVPFDRARFKAIRDVWQLLNTARYVVRQDRRHGLTDPFLEGSVIPDVLGLRLVEPGIADRARVALPRVRASDWAEWVGWSDWERAPMVVDALADAAAAAVGLAHLEGRGPSTSSARLAACHVGNDAGLSRRRVASLLGVSVRAVQLALERAPDPRLRRAIEGQLRLRGRLGARGTPPENAR